jgi:O-antigen/teichoic acid export membrane protein
MRRADSTTTTQRIGRAMAWTVASRAGRFALGFASSVMVVRGLGEYDYGVLSVVRSVLMFAVLLAGLGTGQALLKFLPVLRVGGSPAAARRLVRRVAAVHTLTWVGLVGVAFAFRDSAERLFHAEGIGVYVVAAVALALFEILFTVATHVLNAAYDTARLSAAALASHLVYIAGLALVLPMGWGVPGVLVAGAAGNAVACALITGRLRAASAFAEGGSGADVAPGRLWRYSLPFAAIGVLNLVVWRQSETLLLAHFRTAEEAGFFDLAYRVPQTVLEFVPGTVWPLIMAGMSEAYTRDPARLRVVVERYYRLLFLLCAPLCAAGVVLGGRVVGAVFGENMSAAALPTQVFFAIFTVSFLSTPLSMALYVLERTHVNLLVYLLLALINVGLDLILIPKYGVPGAMIPVAIAIAVQPAAYFLAVRRRVPGISIPFAFIGRCFLASSAVLVAVPVLWRLDGLPGLLAATTAAGVALAWAYRRARLFSADELDAVAAIPVPLAGRLAHWLRAAG